MDELQRKAEDMAVRYSVARGWIFIGLSLALAVACWLKPV